MTRSPAHPGALEALCTLLDRSVSQIAEAAADPYDYSTLCRTADVWDNSTLPLFRAAVAPAPRSRERRARAALVWMADLGSDRRAWMAERIRESGFTLDGLVALAAEPEAGAELVRTRRPRPGGLGSGVLNVGKPVVGRLHPEAEAAARLLIGAMLRIRSARPEADQPELVRALARALDGAGTGVLVAGAHRGHRARERAFRALSEGWVRSGGPLAAPVFARVLNRLDRSDSARGDGPWTGSRGGA